ncbi:ubinuclein-1-like isoform X3 [Prosopis cineraria]|uniref:ubinuclein-1-like isoform X3 n=1 Tax=Prosopis cineraria TaxID=364024 RepID=UPI0024109B39|nr:ubinuclein-1-like isoform X3 [Prosopis cineraria]
MEEKASTCDVHSARVSSSFAKKGDRLIFTVELRPGETTIVSWKKLMRDANKVNGSTSAPKYPTNARPALESRIAPHFLPKPSVILSITREAVSRWRGFSPGIITIRIPQGPTAENKVTDASQPNRFSAVIEKIERLYMGKDSSDEEDLLDVPDDDQYDTEDSFIDDAELDEYFEVDKSVIKHDGFFVNRGKLERISEPSVSANQHPKKRRKKDVLKNTAESYEGQGSNKHVKLGKAATGKPASLPMENTSNSSQNLVVPNENYKESKFQNRLDVLGISSKKRTVDTKPVLDSSVSSKVSYDDGPISVSEAKNVDKQNAGVLQLKNTSNKHNDASTSSDASQRKYHEKSSGAHSKSQTGKPSSNTDDLEGNGRSKEKNRTCELPDLNFSEGKPAMQKAKSHYMHKKDGSSVRPKISVLEKAFRELEKMVVESRPPAGESQEADTVSQAVKRRLPREIKLKLDKVARIARHLKVMVSMSMSAKQEKDNRFQQIKKEVVEMIKVRGSSLLSKLQQQGGASGDYQEFGPDEKALTARKLSMDSALEDKICDLYDLFVDGLDEDAGPQIRKFYAELAQLWPNGYMDNHEIKHAISRSKERRKTLYNRHKDQDKVKRKKKLGARQEGNLRCDALHHNMRERLAPESSSHASTSVNRKVSNTITTARAPSSSMNGPKQEKVKAGSSNPRDNVRIADGVLRKKANRKAELQSEGPHIRPEKLGSLLGEERPKVLKQSAGVPLESNLQPTSIPSLEQSS